MPTQDPFDVVSRGLLELGVETVWGPGQVERIDVTVSSQYRGQLGGPPAQDIDHASRKVRRRQDLRQLEGRKRARLAGDHDRRVPSRDHRGEHAHKTEKRGSLRGEYPDDACGFGDREVEVGPGYRVGRPGHLGELVRPARIPHEAVYGCADIG